MPVERETDNKRILSVIYINRLSFCAPCHLFGGTSLIGKEGFSDWEHANEHLRDHKNLLDHKNCVVAMKQ
jgi:hypothetical protein